MKKKPSTNFSNSLKQAHQVAAPKKTIKYTAPGTDGRNVAANSNVIIAKNVPKIMFEISNNLENLNFFHFRTCSFEKDIVFR